MGLLMMELNMRHSIIGYKLEDTYGDGRSNGDGYGGYYCCYTYVKNFIELRQDIVMFRTEDHETRAVASWKNLQR